MASGGTAAPIAMSNPPRPLLDQDSTVSSPLSEVMNSTHSDGDEFERPDHSHTEDTSKPPAHDDSDSNLSDLETNDSEAETERLYDSPRRNHLQPNIASAGNNEQLSTSNKVLNAFQRSPSKLQEQVRAGVATESGDDDNDDLSEDHQDADDEEKGSRATSEIDNEKIVGSSTRKSLRNQRNKTQDSRLAAGSAATGSNSDDSSAETRKRKRSPLADPSNAVEPNRNRGGSPTEAGDETSSLSKIMSEDLAPSYSAGHKSAEHSGDEEDPDTVMRDAEEPADSIEKPPAEPSRLKKSKRTAAKRRKGFGEEVAEERVDAEEPTPEEGHAVEDERAEAEADEETEAAHYLQELEKKRNAFDQLSSIEKNFAVLRDRLYEERLAQLNEEEAMLSCENPTHPEYLAMMQCIDSRRDERVRVAELEHRFTTDALERWAVSRRSQILSQFYQSVRETREKTLEELGRQWYEIQHERRKNANPILDYGFRFPKSKAQQKRQAIAHSKETSILSGIAQHHGFPAAPEMKGLTSTEVEEDFETMHRARQSIMGPVHHVQPALNEYGAVPFGRNLGPAGEQFLEQTPWANPKHPAHHSGPRRHSQGAYAGPPAFQNQPKAHHQSAPTWLANGQAVNGDSSHKHAPVVADHELLHARKTNEAAKAKREAILS